MALVNAQTTADITLSPDAVQLLDVFASLQSNTKVVMDGNVNTAVTADTQVTYNLNSQPTPTHFEQEAHHVETEVSVQASSDAPAYLADVATDLAVRVEAYASDAAYDVSQDKSDDEAQMEEAYEEALEVEASYENVDNVEVEELSVEQAVYAEAQTGSQTGTQLSAAVQANDRIDLSWLGAKFAHDGMTLDIHSTVQAQGQVQDQALDAYAEDLGEPEGYAEVNIAGEIDLTQDHYDA